LRYPDGCARLVSSLGRAREGEKEMAVIAITVTSNSTPKSFRRDAAEQKIKFHTERGDGTYRRVHYLAENTLERQTGEWVVNQRTVGRTMRQIANEMHVSIPTVRRILNDMMLTQEIEEASEEDLAEWLKGAEEAQE